MAKKLKTKHRRKGVDHVKKGVAVETAVSDADIKSSVAQLKKSRAQKKYMAVPASKEKMARELLKDTGIGIMDLNKTIKKRSRKKKK